MYPADKNKFGFVLISVLWVTAMLTVITLGFGRRVALDRRAAAYALDQSEALLMARGAVDRGIVEMYNRGLMQLLLPPDQRGSTHLGEAWAQSKNLFDENYYERSEDFEGDEVIHVITDEERYININTTSEKVLEEIDGLSRSVIRKILARRKDEVHEKEGVSPFQAIEEIRYLQGVSEEDWFGERDRAGLKNLLTVWGNGLINVNTASAEVLGCIPEMRKTDISAILNYRAGSDGTLYTSDDRGFLSMEDLTDKTGVTGASREALDQYCLCTSTFFRITGVATRRLGRIRAVCSAVISFGEGGSIILDWQEKTLGS
jgi:type II secretory pathway component PulK